MSVWSERVTGLLADDVLEAWEAAPDFVGSVRAMATVLTTDDSPPIGKLVKGSRAFVGSQLMAEAGKQAKKAVLQRALDKGAKEGAAKLLGGGAGTAVGLTYKLGKLALRPDECSKADVAKALATSATTLFLGIAFSPLLGGSIGLAVSPVVEKAVDRAFAP